MSLLLALQLGLTYQLALSNITGGNREIHPRAPRRSGKVVSMAQRRVVTHPVSVRRSRR